MERSRSRVLAAAPRCRADFRRTVSSRPPAEGGAEGGRGGSRTDFGTEPIPGGTKARRRRSKDRSERSGSDGRTDGRTDGRGLCRSPGASPSGAATGRFPPTHLSASENRRVTDVGFKLAGPRGVLALTRDSIPEDDRNRRVERVGDAIWKQR